MTRQIRHIKGNYGTTPEEGVRRDFEDDRPLSSKDSALWGMIDKYMKGWFDLEEVRNDPARPGMKNIVNDMISDYKQKRIQNKDDEKFIRDNFTVEKRETKVSDEIDQIKLEIDYNKINEIAEDWVKEWHEKGNKDDGSYRKKEEIRDFITSSLKNEKSDREIEFNHKLITGSKRSSLVRYISLSAAAAIALFVLIRILLPASDPDKIYSSFYEPFNVISPVTRSFPAIEADDYSAAVEKYKLGDYQAAASEFSNAILKDNSAITPRFFMGITHLELGNYDQAVNLLSNIIDRSGEYDKEAEWYLGLAYLKTGEKDKASACFELLAKTPGFYHERADKILRRLK
jgi:TolA-binding protein